MAPSTTPAAQVQTAVPGTLPKNHSPQTTTPTTAQTTMPKLTSGRRLTGSGSGDGLHRSGWSTTSISEGTATGYVLSASVPLSTGTALRYTCIAIVGSELTT